MWKRSIYPLKAHHNHFSLSQYEPIFYVGYLKFFLFWIIVNILGDTFTPFSFHTGEERVGLFAESSSWICPIQLFVFPIPPIKNHSSIFQCTITRRSIFYIHSPSSPFLPHQGLFQTIQTLSTLCPPNLTVEPYGCLGKCGADPNLVFSHSQSFIPTLFLPFFTTWFIYYFIPGSIVM